MKRGPGIVLLGLLLLGACGLARGSEYFVSTTGSDGNPGTIEKPFATVQEAQAVVSPGDTVYIRGGTYSMKAEQVARRRGIWADVTFLDRSGTPGRRINYWAYRDERPVFDFSSVKLAGVRIDAFYVSGSWLHIKGLEVVGVQVTLKGHTQSICFENDGSHNIYEQLGMHDGQAIGIYSVKGSDNLFLNCDAYRNHDFTSEDGKGGNVDGFGCHPPKGGTGNVFRGCRAWFNSDDGFDCIGAREPVTFENCWAFFNGYTPKFERLADGNGFKAGGYGSTAADKLPRPIPRHQVIGCVAVGNKASGFYANHHPGGSDWFNNTGFRNGTDFNMLGRLLDNRTDVDGTGHKLRNNIAYKGRALISRMDSSKCDSANNSFTLGLPLRDQDFVNLDEAELVLPRRADGELPALNFLRPSPGSVLIDKGVDVGRHYQGAAPDLGAIER
jgi:hypothetical protein